MFSADWLCTSVLDGRYHTRYDNPIATWFKYRKAHDDAERSKKARELFHVFWPDVHFREKKSDGLDTVQSDTICLFFTSYKDWMNLYHPRELRAIGLEPYQWHLKDLPKILEHFELFASHYDTDLQEFAQFTAAPANFIIVPNGMKTIRRHVTDYWDMTLQLFYQEGRVPELAQQYVEPFRSLVDDNELFLEDWFDDRWHEQPKELYYGHFLSPSHRPKNIEEAREAVREMNRRIRSRALEMSRAAWNNLTNNYEVRSLGGTKFRECEISGYNVSILEEERFRRVAKTLKAPVLEQYLHSPGLAVCFDEMRSGRPCAVVALDADKKAHNPNSLTAKTYPNSNSLKGNSLVCTSALGAGGESLFGTPQQTAPAVVDAVRKWLHITGFGENLQL